MKVQITNEFHGTSTSAFLRKITAVTYEGYYFISKPVARRIKRTLCGNKNCVCGGIFGDRPNLLSSAVVNENASGYFIDPRHPFFDTKED